MSNTPSNIPAPDNLGTNWLHLVQQHVESLRFGAVEIIVHEGRVIQIEKTERLRFEKGGNTYTSETARGNANLNTKPGTK